LPALRHDADEIDQLAGGIAAALEDARSELGK
jgi:hypothetical protein